MPDDERIEQLELQNKVLQANNKGLKDTTDELRDKNAELRDDLEVKNAELNKEKEKNRMWENFFKKYFNEIETEFHGLLNHKFVDYIVKDKIKAKIEELYKEHNKYKRNLGLQYSKAGLINSQIQVLQELLEEEE